MSIAHLLADAFPAIAAKESLGAAMAPALVERIWSFRLPARDLLFFPFAGFLFRGALFRDLLALAFKLAAFAFQPALLIGHAFAFQSGAFLFQREGVRGESSGAIRLHLADVGLRAFRMGGLRGIGCCVHIRINAHIVVTFGYGGHARDRGCRSRGWRIHGGVGAAHLALPAIADAVEHAVCVHTALEHYGMGGRTLGIAASERGGRKQQSETQNR